MAAAGYDFVHNYAWMAPGATRECPEYLDEAQIMACRRSSASTAPGCRRDEECVAERVGASDGTRRSLPGYFDEPDLATSMCLPTIPALYQLIKALDPPIR